MMPEQVASQPAVAKGPSNTTHRNSGAPNSNSKYQINVNRSKTRKWANFKPQNYDGDDWGSEEYEEGEEEPPPAPRHGQPVKQYKPYTPALHLQTQQPPAAPSGRIAQMLAAGSTPATPNVPERAGTFGQPQYDAPRTASPVVGGKQVLPSMMRVATMPQNIGPGATPTQFPPRKSSMGPREIPDMTDPTRQPRSTTWAVPSQKPWSDARSASPNARSPISPTEKPLPLPRPTDIYRRMGENNNTGPQSSGAVNQGQPGNGAYTAGGNPGPYHQERRGSATGNEGGDNSWGRRPSLAPVAERNSEYGAEGLLAKSASKDSAVAPVAFGEEEDKVRRSSTSPKLPDLARLSGFGEDLFSTRFSVLAPQLASIPDTPNPSSPAKAPEHEGTSVDESAEKAGNPENGIVTPANPIVAPTSLSVAEPVSTVQAPPSSIGGAAVSDATPQFAQKAIRSESPPNESVGLLYTQDDANGSHAVANAPQQLPYTMEAPRETSSSDMDKQAVRPRLPGGWVTETVSTPGETPPPARASTDTFANMTSSFPQPPSSSPVAKSHADAERASNIDQSQQNGSGNPIEAAIESSHSASDGEAAQPTPTSDKDTHASLAPTMEPSKHRDITPTAPLNFNRGLLGGKSSEPLHVLPSPNVGGDSNLNTPGDSPLKESDLLRDEITKFLGDPEISGSFLDIAHPSSTPNHPVADATRESSYFGDVYGDYFAASEDNLSLTKPGANAQPGETDTPTPGAAGTPKAVVVAPLSVGTSTSSGSGAATSASKQDSAGETAGAPELRRRFSWEGPSEQEASNAPEVNSDHHVEQKSRSSGPDGVSFASRSPTTERIGETMAPTLSNADEPLSTPTASANKPAQAAPLGTSHDVSEVSMFPSHSMFEPASPISATSDEDAAARHRSLSMGQDKILVQPSEQHPTLEVKLPSRPGSSGPKDPVNIISFRQIMDMPSSTDRLRHYNETRLQFAAIDTGLEEWLLAMKSKYPEHSNATSSFKDSLTIPVTPMDAQQAGEVSALSPGYFQQGNRPGTNMPMPPNLPHGHSGFAHSSQQVGTKGRELLFAAGKAGKGLLSKGKSKLKGTGDKVFF